MTAKKITKIQLQKRNPNRRTIYIDGEYFCGVDEEIIHQLGLSEGQFINESQLSEVIEHAEKKKAKEYVLTLLSFRARTIKEVTQRLTQKGFDFKTIEYVISNCCSTGLLNDLEFAKNWIASRLSSRPCGKRLLEQELRNKGVEQEIIEQAITEHKVDLQEVNLALKAACQRIPQYRNVNHKKAKQRIYSYLLRRGFCYDTILEVIEKLSFTTNNYYKG